MSPGRAAHLGADRSHLRLAVSTRCFLPIRSDRGVALITRGGIGCGHVSNSLIACSRASCVRWPTAWVCSAGDDPLVRSHLAAKRLVRRFHSKRPRKRWDRDALSGLTTAARACAFPPKYNSGRKVTSMPIPHRIANADDPASPRGQGGRRAHQGAPHDPRGAARLQERPVRGPPQVGERARSRSHACARRRVHRDSLAVRRDGVAQIALVGPPNAGKSSLLQALSSIQIKTGDYAFTTTRPVPSVTFIHDCRVQLVEIPGLIAGAAEDRGGGTRAARRAARRRRDRALPRGEHAARRAATIRAELEAAGIDKWTLDRRDEARRGRRVASRRVAHASGLPAIGVSVLDDDSLDRLRAHALGADRSDARVAAAAGRARRRRSSRARRSSMRRAPSTTSSPTRASARA